MKALVLSSVLALGLAFAGSTMADAQAYNSKTTQNVSYAPPTGGAFDGTYLGSKGWFGPRRTDPGAGRQDGPAGRVQSPRANARVGVREPLPVLCPKLTDPSAICRECTPGRWRRLAFTRRSPNLSIA